MSKEVLIQMCEEMIAELRDCIDNLNDDWGDLKSEWKDIIFDAYKIICK